MSDSKYFKAFKLGGVKNLKVEKPSEDDLDRSEGIINWGFVFGQNNYPNTLLRTIKESPTANACMRKRTTYVAGDGFNIPEIEDIPVNKEQRFKKLHIEQSETVTKMNGVAFHVRRKPTGEIAQISKVPFEDVRLGIPNENQEVTKVMYNPRWEQRDFKNYETKEYDLYTKDKALFQQRLAEWNKNPDNEGRKYPGEIYWNCIKNDGFPYYPFPFSDIDFKVFETDSAFSNFDYNNIKNNFLVSAVMNIYGDPNEGVYETYKNSKGEEVENYLGTRGELFNEEMQNAFAGDENAGSVLTNWKRNNEENLSIEAFPNNTNSDLFVETQDRIWNKIAHICGVPNILANIKTAGQLGDSQEILNAIQLLNSDISPQQSLLEEAYNELLPNMGIEFEEEIKITAHVPSDHIPDKIWEAIPTSAKLKYIRDNFNIEIEEQELMPAQPISPAPVNKIKAQESYNDYPEAAVTNAKKVVEWKEEHPDEIEGMTQTGWIRANQLADRESLTRETIAKMAAFERHRGNSELDEEFRGEPWKDAGYVAWLGWGGDEGIAWAQDKLDQIEENE